MRKLEARICKCGRIHFYSTELLQSLLEAEKELVLICSKCGNVTRIGADIEPAVWYDEDADPEAVMFNMYAMHSENEEIGAEDFNQEIMHEKHKRTIGKILINEGVPVYMGTGDRHPPYIQQHYAGEPHTSNRVVLLQALPQSA